MMTIDDFDIIVSTTNLSLSVERRKRLTQYFANAGITRYTFDEEPVCTHSELLYLRPGAYGCGRHFANILKHNAGRDIIYVEDDAIVPPDCRDKMNHHLTQLPYGWGIFVAGYSKLFTPVEHVCADFSRDIITVGKHCGNQCLVIRAGEWQLWLADAILSHDFYNHEQGGFDVGLSSWCKANNVGLFFAAESFVGQCGCVSIITGRWRDVMGMPQNKQ